MKRAAHVQLNDINEDGDGSSTKASQSKAVEIVINKIVDRDVVNGETLYRVRRYEYKTEDVTAQPADHPPDHFIKAY